MNLPKRHMIGKGISSYCYVVVAIACVAISFWPPYSSYWPVIAVRIMVSLVGIFLGWYIFLEKRIGANLCGVWLYKGPLFKSGRSQGKSDLRVCNKCGECQENIGIGRYGRGYHNLSNPPHGGLDHWVVVIFDEFVKKIAEAEKWAEKHAEEEHAVAQQAKEQMIERARQEEREHRALEESRKKALEWVKATASYGKNLPAKERNNT